MILEPLEQHDPRLRQVCVAITRTQLRDRAQQREIDALLDFVYGVSTQNLPDGRRDLSHPNTVGLSANQVGIMKQISVIDLSIGHRGYTDVHVLVNPRIVAHSRSVVEKPEGCVNFPTTWGMVRRSRSVQVAALDRSGNELTFKLTGWAAVLLQHEIDHLQGVLFIDRLVDPEKAHLVKTEEYPEYRKIKPQSWGKFIDVSGQVRHVND